MDEAELQSLADAILQAMTNLEKSTKEDLAVCYPTLKALV
jgi:hypothetical protein